MAKRDLIWMIITLLLAVPGVALPEAPQSDAVFKSQLEKLRTARDSWEKALSLEEILPKVREAQRKLLPIAPHLVENQTRI